MDAAVGEYVPRPLPPAAARLGGKNSSADGLCDHIVHPFAAAAAPLQLMLQLLLRRCCSRLRLRRAAATAVAASLATRSLAIALSVGEKTRIKCG